MSSNVERKSEKRNFTARNDNKENMPSSHKARNHNKTDRISKNGDIIYVDRNPKNMKKNIGEYIKIFNLIMNNPSEKVDTVYNGTVSYIYHKLQKTFTAPVEKENIRALIRKKINDLFGAKIKHELAERSLQVTNNQNRRQFMAAHFLEQSTRDTCYVCNQQLMRGKCSPHVEHIIRILPLYLLMGHIKYENNSIHQLAIKESHRLCNLMKSTVSLLEYSIDETNGKIIATPREDSISQLSHGIHDASKSVGLREVSDKYYFRETDDRKQPIIKDKVLLPWPTTYIQTKVGQKVNQKNVSEYEIIQNETNAEGINENLTKEIIALAEAINEEPLIDIYNFYDNLNMLLEEIKDQFAVKGGKTKKTKRKYKHNKTRSKRI